MIIFQIICITYKLDKCPSEIGLGRGQTPQYGIFLSKIVVNQNLQSLMSKAKFSEQYYRKKG